MINLREHLNESGNGRVRVYFWIIFGFLALYAGYMIVPTYVSYKMMQKEVETEAGLAHHYSDAEMRTHIKTKADSWNIPITTDDIDINRRRNTIAISIAYSIDFNFFNRYKRTIYYDIDVVDFIKKK